MSTRALVSRNNLLLLVCSSLLLASLPTWSQDEIETDEGAAQGSDLIPDIRESKSRFKYRNRNFVVVPIPMSNPTLDTGLVLAGAWFWPQTEAQKAVQPASSTGAAGFYTSNDSYAFGVAHRHYWDEDRWRFEGLLAHLNLNLELRVPVELAVDPRVDWFLEGELLQLNLLRKISGRWYGGITGRYISLDQRFGIEFATPDVSLDSDSDAVGFGIQFQYDSTDMPINSYSGQHFEFESLFNSKSLGSNEDYQWYKLRYRSYHQLRQQVILAWEVRGCLVTDDAPLWDTCRVDLRGFPVTEYLGDTSGSGQVELRWSFHRKWGAVAFAGAGAIGDSFSDPSDDIIPSYGVGLRFMVLEDHRINVRLDYARSDDNDAVYLSVGEAF